MKLPRAIGALCDAALSLVYPQACGACGEECVESRADAPACAKCWRATRLFDGGETLCWKCGAPAHASLPAEKRSGVRCARSDPWEFAAAGAGGAYAGALAAYLLGLTREA